MMFVSHCNAMYTHDAATNFVTDGRTKQLDEDEDGGSSSFEYICKLPRVGVAQLVLHYCSMITLLLPLHNLIMGIMTMMIMTMMKTTMMRMCLSMEQLVCSDWG